MRAWDSSRIVAPSGYVDRLCLQAQRMRAIPRLSIAAEGDPEKLVHAVCTIVPSLFSADGVAVLLDDGDGKARVRAVIGFGEPFALRAAFALDEVCPAGSLEGQVLRLDGYRAEARPLEKAVGEAGHGRALWANIRSRGRLSGGLLVGRRFLGEEFSDDDLLYAELLADYIGARVGELVLRARLTRLQRGLVEAARRASIGQLASSVAEEINESLEVLAGPAAQPQNDVLHREVERLRTLTRSFIQLLADGVGDEPVALSVRTLLLRARELMDRHLEEDGVEVTLECEEGLAPLVCRPVRLEQALLALMDNARLALNERFPMGGPQKRLKLSARTAGEDLELEIWDSGTGIPAGVQAHLFEPLFTTRGPSEGLGLGLVLCRDIVRAHHGTIRVESEAGQFTRVVMALPLGAICEWEEP